MHYYNLLFIAALFTPVAVLSQITPPIMLAETYQNQNINGWLASEKLDGVRGYWDGEKLLSRNGNFYDAPTGFTNHFPPFPIDGELYIGRGKFAETSSKVRSGKDWSDIKL